ncbi:hypothetical protein D0N36_14625 [Hymenobacter lapidiphilus]|uniref:hypothetical protein n=1 Tax=Hymenobacter sp. CCM 8763 TaxID=2303334 RepID=UPI000E3473C9|nr:hypothetical protein [Hymenobacter sp. CCM 8763]RFP64292.1 hypothetical protein D0N36_14625 [Hymenobacter sp. CCM 8763]
MVKTFVQQTQAKYGLTLYLPSEEPDLDWPRWTEREQARACDDCGKLGFPTDSPYLPKHICYTCHLKREQKAHIQHEQPCDDGVNLYVYNNGVYRSVGYVSQFDSFAIAPYVDPSLLLGAAPPTIHVITLEHNALVEIQAHLAEALEKKLACYKPAEKESRKSHSYHFEHMAYQGVTYELELKWHERHREIRILFDGWDTTRGAIADGSIYKIYFKRGISYRDDSLLRHLNYPIPSPKTIDQLVQHYSGILSQEEISSALAKLEAMHCLEVVGRDVTITQTGRNIV